MFIMSSSCWFLVESNFGDFNEAYVQQSTVLKRKSFEQRVSNYQISQWREVVFLVRRKNSWLGGKYCQKVFAHSFSLLSHEDLSFFVEMEEKTLSLTKIF